MTGPPERLKLPARKAEWAEALARAGIVLRTGGLIVVPTDTVYGLACDPHKPDAVERLYEAKGRPRDRALVLLAATISELERAGCHLSHTAWHLAERHWPGPLTLVLPAPDSQLAFEGTLGVRIPDQAFLLELLAAYGPLYVTSANRSGDVAPSTADEADVESNLVIDAGRTRLGMESTVVDLTGDLPRILREGAVAIPEGTP